MTFSSRILTVLLLIGVMVCPLLVSCEKVAPYVEKAKKVLNRAPEPEPEALPEVEGPIPPPPQPVKMEPTINKDARVSVLGYHDFTEGASTNDMILNIQDFRNQMQAIRDAKLPVISMQQFLDWKRGKADIPAQSIMITIDDGWKDTHTLALGVLKEFEYPFTIFLYKNYINIGGRSMSLDQIREIAANGGTISSHTTSHQSLSARGERSQQAYDDWLRDELAGSIQYLEKTFGDTKVVAKTLAYPFGIYNDRVIELAREGGYEACFTVNGKKTTWDTDDMLIGRYVVHGKTLANFDPALDFGGSGETSAGRKLLAEHTTNDGKPEGPLVTVSPTPDSLVGDRMPEIKVDLSKLEAVNPESIVMRISGFGRVSPKFDPVSSVLKYQIPQVLRTEACAVQLSFRHGDDKTNETINWTFRIEPIADYLSGIPALEKEMEGKDEAEAPDLGVYDTDTPAAPPIAPTSAKAAE